jgi:DNA-binding NarL/FixJ family response regulator
VEDFDNLRLVFASRFIEGGYDVYSSATLRHALAIAQEETPQTIIVDYKLSDEEVSHATASLREVLPNGYILLIGVPDEETIREKIRAAGATEFLSDFRDASELDRIISRALVVSK